MTKTKRNFFNKGYIITTSIRGYKGKIKYRKNSGMEMSDGPELKTHNHT